MPSRVVLVHDEPSLIEQVARDLTTAGYQVTAFEDPMAAILEIETARSADVLITNLVFEPGKPTGLSLALMTMLRRPEIKVLFIGKPKLAHHAEGVGEFLAIPFSAADIVEAVKRLQAPGRPISRRIRLPHWLGRE